MADARGRQFDVVIFGATGFSGRLAAEYFATHYLGQSGAALRMALGGRSQQKLEALKAELAAVEPAAAQFGVLVGDSSKLEDMRAIAEKAKVVASTAGPFTLHGSSLLQACAEAGTSYCDITGEASWVARMAALHHSTAASTGARLVCCAGFDSVPSDIGTLLAVQRFKADFGREPEQIDVFVRDLSGGVQGGTIETVMNELSGGGAKVPQPEGGAPVPLGLTQAQYPKGLWYDGRVGLWTVPYFMSPANYPVVERSNAQLGYTKQLRYREHLAGSLPFCSAVLAGLCAGGTALLLPPTRWLVRRLLPAPGEGPSRSTMLAGCCSMTFLASGGGKQVLVDWRARGDPSCVQTTIFLAETAVSLALDSDRLPLRGGVLTPASACGDALWARLRQAKWARGDEGPAITANFTSSG